MISKCPKLFLCLVLGLLTAPWEMESADVEDANVALTDFKLPEYNKDTKELEFIIYGDHAKTVGVLVELKGVKVDWHDREISRVKATMTSPSATYDRATKMIKGDEDVHFRAPEMDADGVGFDADYEKETIHIRSNVKVTLKGDLGTMYKEQAGSEK